MTGSSRAGLSCPRIQKYLRFRSVTCQRRGDVMTGGTPIRLRISKSWFPRPESLPHHHVTTLKKSFTLLCLCRQTAAGKVTEGLASQRVADLVMFSVGGNDMEIRIHMHRTVVFITTATLLYSRRYRRRRRGPEEHSPKEDVVRHYALCLLPTLTTVDCNESYYFRYCVVLILPYVVSVSSYYFSNVDT